MRPIEIVLVLANLLALVASVRKLPTTGWVGIAGLNGVVLLAHAVFAFPVFVLRAPTGEYPVGVRYLELTDETRVEPFLANTAQKRRLMVKLYYPAVQDDSVPFLPYFRGSKRLMRAFAEFY